MKRHSAIFLVRNFQAEIRISCLQTFFGILVSGFRGRFSLNKTDLGNCKRDYRTESALSANFYDTQPVEKVRYFKLQEWRLIRLPMTILIFEKQRRQIPFVLKNTIGLVV